jgi:hypothetical protein
MEEEKMKLDIEKMKEINGGANNGFDHCGKDQPADIKDRGGGNTDAPDKKADVNRFGLSTIKDKLGGNA